MNENNANFTPAAPNFKTLVRMSFQGLTNFPYIEEDFDALTNYGLLSKVVEYLNTVISNNNEQNTLMTNLYNAYVSLQDYVNNYFDNLDVQDEINNKLDKMAQDGSLTNLIKNYIDPIVEDQNNRISIINNKVNSATNGAPLAATSTSEMTDTDKIYVNTTDGHWYYYNGTTWTQGGIYQSSGISDKSITYNNLETELQNSFIQDTITTNYQIIKNKFVNINGGIIDLNSFSCYDITNIEALASYEIYINFKADSYSSDAICYAFLDESNNIISSVNKASAISTGILDNNILHAIIESPYNAKKLRINTTADYATQYNRILKINKYIQNNIKKEQLDTKLQSFFNDEYTNVSPTLFKDGAFFDGNKVFQSVSGYSIYEMNVEPNTKYQITIKQIYSNPILIFSTPNYYTDKTINDITYRYQGLVDSIQSETSSAQFTNYEFITPNYCNKIYINLENGKSMTLKKSTSYDIKLEEIDLNYIKNQVNPLNNKTLLFTGDSICAASTSGVKGWWRLIQENNPTANVYNYGVDGATIAISTNNPTKNVVNYIQTMHTEHADADYIIIQGGVNDYWNSSITLGTFEPNSNFNGETPYDTTTFSGALEWIFNYCLNNFGSKKVGYIVTQKINAGSNNFYQYMDRAKEICKKWSIPYIDLFNESDLNYFVTYQKQNYSITTVDPNGDGTHPNLAGYQILTPKIENWLKYKI